MVTKPKKELMVVILSYGDCINKMMLILDDEKFIKLGPVESFVKSKNIEFNFQKHLKLVKQKLLLVNIYKVIKTIWFTGAPVYICNLRPIRTMLQFNLFGQNLAKRLTEL